MQNERTLSYAKSQKLTAADLECVSAASGTVHGTVEVTYHSGTGWDTAADISND